MSGVDLVPLVDEGLGNSAYLVDLGDGRALVVDVSRDLRGCVCGRRPARVDSGVRRRHPPARRLPFRCTPTRREVTPDHTHEHMAFLLLDGDREVGVFTGGSLIVGSAARTDLASDERTEELARALYGSLRRLAALPADVEVWPTHGVGSFCSAPPAAERTSTIAHELATNPLLAVPDENDFVSQLVGSLGSYPPHFRRLGEVNRVGPALLDGDPTLPPLRVDAVRAQLADGAVLIDARPIGRFGAAHVAGAISIPLRPAFANWLGWLAPVDRPLIIVRDGDQDSGEIAWQAAKIGCDNIVGELDGAITGWTAAGRDTTTIRLMGVAGLDDRHILDIRQRSAYVAGHLPGAVHVELGAISKSIGDIPDEPTVVMCGHGERAMGGASLLEAAGHCDLVVLDGRRRDWVRATGGELETGA